MNPGFVHVLLTLPGAFSHCGQLVWLWSVFTRPGATLGFLDGFGSGNKKQSTVTTSYQDAFNTSTSNISSSGDAGNVSLDLGGGGGGGGMLDGVLPVLLAALFLFGGLFLVTRRS